MKKRILVFSSFLGIGFLTLTGYVNGPFQGGAGNRTGSAGSSANCSTGGCHSANTANTTPAIFIAELATPTTPVTSYVPGQTYKVSIGATNSSASLSRFGFQISCVRSSATSTAAGTFSTAGTSNIALRSSSPAIVEHTTPISAISTGVYGVQFEWTAPAAGTGSVTFYGIVNVVNNNNSTTGDQPNSTTTTVTEATTSVKDIIQNVALSAYPSPTSDVLHLDIDNSQTKNYNATIHDLSGRAVKTVSIKGGKTEVDIKMLNAGHYTIVVKGENSQGTARFVKQ